MSIRNSQCSSNNNYNEAEGLISEALTKSSSDLNTALSLYKKAMIQLIQIRNNEKKDIFRNFYDQRISDVLKQIRSLQSSCGIPIMNLEDFNKLTDDSQTNANIKITTPEASGVCNSTISLSLYPTLPDLILDGNDSFPTINPEVSNSNEFINQANMQFCQFQPQIQQVPNYTQSQIIPPSNYIYQIPSNSATTSFSPSNYIYNINPPVFPPSYSSSNNSHPIMPDLNYPFSIPIIQPELIKVEDKPFSQPSSTSNALFNPNINKSSSSFSNPDDLTINKQSNTQNFKKCDITNSIDHFDGIGNDSKSNTNIIYEVNINGDNLDDSFPKPKNKIKKHKKKKHHKSEPKFNVSDKIINISQNFKIESLLGSGTFGNVYLATEYSSQKKYAIKELKDFEDRYENSISFFREIEALTKANHPAVLHLYGFSLLLSKDKRYPAIVTEYLPGGTLLDVIHHKKTVTMTEKLILIYGICEAMHYLHDKLHIVHRDLKPENVMLNSNNEPIVCDFGLSKTISDDYMFQTQVAGSPCYMAPELLRDEEYSDKVDVYSYGIMCYELLSGKMAYPEAKNITELMPIVLSGKRPPLENETNIPQVFKELITSCWNGDEALRPTFYDLASRFRKMEFIVENCDKIAFRKYVTKCLCRK